MRQHHMVSVARILVAVVLLAGCNHDPLSPFQPEINNAADNFQLQATAVTHVTHTREYAWQNSGTRGTVNHSTSTVGGTARLVIRDAAGVVVYDKALSPSLTESTTVGTAGAWRIQLVLTDYSGTLNVRVQKL